MGTKQAIRKKAKELKLDVIQFSISQKVRWQKVSELLEKIDKGSGEVLHVFNETYVELSTGRLIKSSGTKASTGDVLWLAQNIERLDAQTWIERLRSSLKNTGWKKTWKKAVKKK